MTRYHGYNYSDESKDDEAESGRESSGRAYHCEVDVKEPAGYNKKTWHSFFEQAPPPEWVDFFDQIPPPEDDDQEADQCPQLEMAEADYQARTEAEQGDGAEQDVGFNPNLYKFNEGQLLNELQEYVNSTYRAHYSQNKFQATEFIIDCGHGEGFALGNVLKYVQRYGKKSGYNRADLMKVLHYALIALHNHDLNNEESP